MNCKGCAREIEADSSFCRFCGTAQAAARESAERPRLQRLPLEAQVGGVCAGLAAYLDTDVTVIRLAWIYLSIIPGFVVGGLVVYGAAWLLLPASETDVPRLAVKRLTRPDDDRLIGGVCGGVASYCGIDATILRAVCAVLAVYPGAIIGGLVAYAVAWVVIPPAKTAFETVSRPA